MILARRPIPVIVRVNRRTLATAIVACGFLFQLGGCVDTILPAVFAVGEQVLLGQIFARLPLF